MWWPTGITLLSINDYNPHSISFVLGVTEFKKKCFGAIQKGRHHFSSPFPTSFTVLNSMTPTPPKKDVTISIIPELHT